jgi:MFS family permease
VITAPVRTALLGLAVGVVLADGSIVTMALPDILARYDLSVPTVAWVLTSFNLVLALVAVPAALLGRRRPRAAFGAGLVVFAAASIACAAATSFPVLIAGRCIQALGGALVVSSALAIALIVAREEKRVAHTWALAGLIGAALGPAVGGILTQVLGWEAIFALQVPLALVALAALVGLTATPADLRPVGRPHVAANTALLLLSGALAAALFLLVILLVNGWRLEPLAAGIVVTVMPAAAILTGRYAHVTGTPAVRAAAGAILAAGGLAGLALLPRADWWWTVPPQLLVGAGLALTLGALTERALAGRSPQAVHGGWTIASRHAGVVLGLLLLTPIFTNALDENKQNALRAGTAVVLDSAIAPLEKLKVAQDVLHVVEQADGQVPDVRPAVDPGKSREHESVAGRLQDQLDRAATHAFSSSFLLAAVLALLALIPIAWRREEPEL